MRKEPVGSSGMKQHESTPCLLNKQSRSPRRHQHLHSSSLIHTFPNGLHMQQREARDHEEEEEVEEESTRVKNLLSV